MKPSLLCFLLALVLALGGSAMPAQAQFSNLKKKAQDAMRQSDASAQATAPATDAGTPDREQAIADARTLIDAYDAHYSAFRDLTDYDRVSHHWPAQGEAWLELVESLEARYPDLQTPMRALLERYGGETIYDVNSTFINDLGVRDSDVGGATSMTTAYSQLEQQMNRVAQFKKDVAAGAVSIARQTMRMLDERFFIPEIRVQKAEELKEQFALAHRFDPQNEELNAMLAQIDVYIDEVAEGVEEEISIGRWPEAFGETQHTRAALDFFRSHEEWGGKEGVEVLAVAVAGTWVITEKDLLGRPIQWGLSVYVAATKPEWKKMGAARVFDLTALARQGTPAPQAPPFTGYWVGESYLMRLDKVPTP